SAFHSKRRSSAANASTKQVLWPGVSCPDELKFSADSVLGPRKGAQLVVALCRRSSCAQRCDGVSKTRCWQLCRSSRRRKGWRSRRSSQPTSIIRSVLGERPIGVLTGPSHAEEVARGLPASLVCASKDTELAHMAQRAFSCDNFRVYTSHDPVGAELAAALKNVVALAAGISDGLELGDNAKAALLTRGMVEMARFGEMKGGEASTFFGLAGFGDLVTTCCSKHSRNRAVGEAIGRGETLEQILERMSMVAEGVWTTKALFGPESDLGDRVLPIAEQVHAILFEKKDPRRAVLDLMSRELGPEMGSPQ
ncbi:UNVERIFIED_CONTAM: hypothetical protein GTU68_057533, partial [Idotea baltica]|nr:hypothetical protein [Idotea baltica]